MSYLSKYTWTRADVLGVSNTACTLCLGEGLRLRGKSLDQPCKCALREIFSSCLRKFRECTAEQKAAALESNNWSLKKRVWYMRREDYISDFLLTSQRTLAANPQQTAIFRYHFLLGADWKLCCRRLDMNRGDFFHHVYRIQQKLGLAFRETQPYSLFPTDEYFTANCVNRLKERIQ